MCIRFGVDIAYDWLANAFGKVRRVEYALIWISFAAVMLLGLEGGIGLGCVLAALQFTWEYARLSSSSITILPSLSSNMRSYDQRSILQMMQVCSAFAPNAPLWCSTNITPYLLGYYLSH